jgi:DNA invertase Pin-like site-specific DNA recombinase
MKAAIYPRASTGEQVNSCDQQVRECTAKAKQLGLTIGEIYTDAGISGSRHDRPAYKRMLADANNKEFDTLLLWKQSRLGRDSVEVERAIRQLEFHGARLVTCDGYDTASGSLKTRKLTRGLNGLIDENYSETLREDTVRGLGDQYAKGYWCGGRVYGYKLVEVTSPTEKDAYGRPKRVGSRLAIDAVQAKIVREIFERYAHGASPQSIAADLNKREVPSPGSGWKRKVRRCKGWARSTLWQMLRDPLYAGTYYWNRTEWVKTDHGRVVKLRKAEERLGHAGNAPELAIIKEATWKLVQQRLSLNNGKPKDKRLQSGGRAVYMLSGLLRCGGHMLDGTQCDAHFVMDSSTHYRCGSATHATAGGRPFSLSF